MTTRLAEVYALGQSPWIAQGIPAIEACIAEGINVNVTLIFSLAA